MLLKRLFFFHIFFVLFVFNVYAENIEKINISGLSSVSRGTVLAYLPFETGEKYSEIFLQTSKKNLTASNLFSNIEISFLNGEIDIKVTENPTIKWFDIKGYKEDKILNESIISEIRQNFKLGLGNIFIKRNFDSFLSNLKKLYQDNAFYESKIKVKTSEDAQNRIGIDIDIDEGKQALISKFLISGNTFFDYEEINELFDMGEPDFFLLNYFTENDHFDKNKFDAGLQSVVNKYVSEGFLDIQIDESNVKYDKNSNGIVISINIEEGNRYKVGEIKIIGDTSNVSKVFLLSKIKLDSGSFFKRNEIIKGIENIRKTFQDIGYGYVKIDSKIRKKGNNILDVDILTDLDKKIYVSRIDITGNTRTQDDVIRRKFKIEEGGLYSKKEIDESIKSIKRLGYFSNVDFEIKRRLNDDDKADIFIDVTEAKTGEFTIGLSHSNSTGASLNAGISQKNFLGTGNTLEAAISNSSAVEELSFYFRDPYYNDKGHTISYGFFNKVLDASNIDASSYILDESGVIFGYGIPLSDSSSIFGETRISSIDITCGNDLKTLYEVSDCNSGDDLDIPLSITYSSNTLNDSFFPTDGSYSEFKGISTTPLSDFKYVKLETNHKSYYPVLDSQTLKLSTRLNFASGYGGDNLPFYKRYYEGGSSSIRGFDFNSLGAKYVNGKPKGGEFSIISSAGIATQGNTFGIDNDNIRLIAFLDAGTIAEKTSDFSLNDVRSSLGVQLSWLTPIGPIGIHLAKPIISKSTDTTESFSFELGSTF